MGGKGKKLPALNEGDQVWVKISHEDHGKRNVVGYQAEGPESYWVAAGDTLVRRDQRHLRRVPPDMVRGPPDVQGAEVGLGTSSGNVHSRDVSRSGKMRRDHRNPMYAYE